MDIMSISLKWRGPAMMYNWHTALNTMMHMIYAMSDAEYDALKTSLLTAQLQPAYDYTCILKNWDSNKEEFRIFKVANQTGVL